MRGFRTVICEENNTKICVTGILTINLTFKLETGFTVI